MIISITKTLFRTILGDKANTFVHIYGIAVKRDTIKYHQHPCSTAGKAATFRGQRAHVHDKRPPRHPLRCAAVGAAEASRRIHASHQIRLLGMCRVFSCVYCTACDSRQNELVNLGSGVTRVKLAVVYCV